jgi:hypothetical protein
VTVLADLRDLLDAGVTPAPWKQSAGFKPAVNDAHGHWVLCCEKVSRGSADAALIVGLRNAADDLLAALQEAPHPDAAYAGWVAMGSTEETAREMADRYAAAWARLQRESDGQ